VTGEKNKRSPHSGRGLKSPKKIFRGINLETVQVEKNEVSYL